jgi:copper chaperone CopZ
MRHKYKISGMTCSGCTAKVKSELLKIGDVLEAEVQLDAPQAVITMNKHIPIDRLQKAVRNAGPYTISEEENSMHMLGGKDPVADSTNDSYYPIYLIFGYIAGATLLIQLAAGHFIPMQWMSQFMAGFFLVFSFFKLLDIQGFAEGYRSYDVVAKKAPVWGFIYPFAELVLGLLFLTGLAPLVTSIVTFIVMGVGSIGVIQSLLKKTPFQCACLGTIIKLPLSKVTLVEDLLMVIMSAIMIILIL